MAPTHFLVMCSPFFGHVRPIFALTMNLLTMYPDLYITYVTTGTSSPAFTPAFEREITLYGLEDEPRSRLNLKLLGEGQLSGLPEQIGSLLTLIPDCLKGIFTAELSDSPFNHVPALAIIDILVLPSVDIMDAVLANTSRRIPALTYTPTNASILNLYWVRKDEYPETYWGPIYREAEKEIAIGMHGGMTVDQIAYQKWCAPSKILARTTSLPPMYHHELNPQTGSLDTNEKSVAVAQAQLCILVTNHMSRFQGFIMHTPPIMEPGEVEEMQRTSPGHLFLNVGPQYPAAWWKDGIPPQVQALSSEDQQVISFLDDMQARHGDKSVLYISFGTTFLPYNSPDLFDALVKTLLDAEPALPFLFAGGTSNPLLTLEHREAIRKSGRGMLAGFVPQQAVLKHKATGWYLCHAGSNSISEAFLNEVPMVLWPYTIDQPLIANQLSVGLKLAFELIQVRTGASIGRPTYRGVVVKGTREAVEEEMRDVWRLMRSSEGNEMRQRVVAFSKAMKEDYYTGAARKAMESFSNFML